MVAQEGAPALTTRAAVCAGHVLGHSRLSDRKAELEQLAMNARCTPKHRRPCRKGKAEEALPQDETTAPPGPPARPEEPPVKSRRRELRSPSHNGDRAAAEYAAAPIGGADPGNRERARRAGDKSPAREPRRRDAHARRGK